MARITWIDDGERFGVRTHPLRLHLVGAAVIAEVLLKWLLLPAIPGAVLMFLGMVLSWAFGATDPSLFGAWPLLLGWAIGLAAALSFCSSRCYDRQTQRFTDELRVFGRRVRCFAWSRALFTDISYGRKGVLSIPGWAIVVRLHTTLDGFLVDAFFPAEDMERARLIGQRLSEYSGLSLIDEPLTTGPQDQLNDLRNNEWVLPRLLAASTDTTLCDQPATQPDPDGSIIAQPASHGGGMSVAFAYLLALCSGLMYFGMPTELDGRWTLWILPVALLLAESHYRLWYQRQQSVTGHAAEKPSVRR